MSTLGLGPSGTVRPLHVLYVTRQMAPRARGGIGTYVEGLARLVHEHGHRVTVLSAAPGQVRSTEDHDGVTVERFPGVGPARLWERLLRGGRPSVARVHGALSAWAALRRLPGRFDVIEAPEWKAEGLLLPRRRRGALVVHLHLALEVVRRWDGPAGPPRSRLGEALERATVRRACRVTATSHLSATLPEGRRWVEGVEIARVPPPVRVDAWQGCPPVERTSPTVVFVGHLERRKAPEVLLEALGRLAGDVPGLRAVFVGRSFRWAEGTGYRDHLLAEAARLGVDCEVRPPTAGPEEMRRLYGEARAVAVPSRFETLSMVALEALACGRPVVMSTAVGAAEWLDADLARLVVPPDDPVALAEALRPVLLDPAEAARVGSAGRRRVAEVCAPHEIVEQRIGLYRAAAGAPARELAPC